jgi:hypothetical protein
MGFYYQRRQNKFGNIKQSYNGGHYDSKKEANKAAELDMLKNGGAIKDWKAHVRLSLDVNDQHVCDYYIDFIVETNEGGYEYIEIKSPITMTPVWKIKWKLAQILYPDPNISWIVET